MRSPSESSWTRVPVVRRQLRDYAVAAVIALVIATAAFVAVRNRDLRVRQCDLAERAAAGQVLPSVHVALVGPATPSPEHPFLRRRTIDGAPFGHQPDAKLIYDAANRFDRGGAFSEMVRDGSGRAIAAVALGDALSVAITGSADPQPFPWLVVIGVLGLGAALAAAGALISRRGLGMFAGVVALSVPTLLWHAWIAAALIATVGALVACLQGRGVTDRLARGLVHHRTALGFLAPAGVAMTVLVAVPFAIGIVLGFFDHHQGTWTFVGVSNFTELLSGGGRSLDDPLNFWFILGVTVLWTVANVTLHVVVGVALALVLSRKWLRCRGVFRMLLILPWAIPNYITALIWKGMFQGQYSAINSLLHAFGFSDVSWFASWSTAFSANVVTNTWLGFPFMMVVGLGALETIPRELYEAASVDGASAWQRFRHITLPHLRPALGPAVALGSIWTFNMFNVIYLVSGGKPGDSTNILVTDAYRWAFERGDRYGMAAAEGALIFLILLLWTVFARRLARDKVAA